jgi:ABC-2 type transport system permease protein
MSATIVPVEAGSVPRPGRVRRDLSDVAAVATRVLLYYRHSPGLLAVSAAAPLAMLVLFGYVFGSAIQVPGSSDYRAYLMPGLFAFITVNGVIAGMTGIARDMGHGITDRLRSMPVSRGAVLLGQAFADALVNAVVLAMMVGVGLAVGWRVDDGFVRACGALALLLLFRFVMIWTGFWLGLLAGREDVAGQLSLLVFPIGMISNVFVVTGGMPGWLRVLAEWNPLSAVTAASRRLFGSTVGTDADAAWPLVHPVVATLVWSAVLLAVFVPLAVGRFARHGR